jgi:cathepsin L
MIAAVALATLFHSASASGGGLDTYSFDRYVAEFRHPWKAGTPEYAERRTIFEKELQRIREHNEFSGTSWKQGVNRFTAMTASERQASLGHAKHYNKHLKPEHRMPLPTNFKKKPVSELPVSVDWRNHGVVSSVKDQGYCGSCWAFAAAATLESHVALNTGLLYQFSPEQIAMCTPNPNNCGGTGGCMGATSELAFEYVAGFGMLEEYQMGYQSYYAQQHGCGVNNNTVPVAKIDGYVKLEENSYDAVMTAVATVGPVAVSVDASTWFLYQSGIFDGCNQKHPDINHAVVLVGYGEENGKKYWIVRNSWSPSWGEKGYIRILRAADEATRCGLDNTPQDGTACDGETDPVTACGTCGMLYDVSYPTGARLT